MPEKRVESNGNKANQASVRSASLHICTKEVVSFLLRLRKNCTNIIEGLVP